MEKLSLKILRKLKKDQHTQSHLSKELGVTRSSVGNWLSLKVNPTLRNRRLLEMYANGKIVIGEGPTRQTIDNVAYQIIESIEDQYTNLADCPDIEPKLHELHNHLDLEVEYSPYDVRKVNELRNAMGLSARQLSEDLGYGQFWFNTFQQRRFNDDDALMLARYFKVMPDYFRWDEII